MPTTRLSRSTPFWVLVGGSVVAIAGGAYLLVSKLTLMASTLTDGTATGVEVYAGQIWAVLGAILVGVGAIGLALALTLGALRSIVSSPAAPVWEEEIVEIAAPAYAPTTTVETVAPVTTPEPTVTASEPAVAFEAEPASEPGTSQPATSQPATSEPGTSEPGTSEPTAR